MSYLALYRKYRPFTFDEVIDQDHIIKTLVNQIKTDKIGHAYLFCGSRGTGKTSTAKIFARAINCASPVNGSACGKCDVCKSLQENSLDIIEIDAASNNGVDEIRDLREKIKYPPINCKYKVYIIDEVHMLTTNAFNALLKTIEEPPAHAVFILATTEPHKLPATILSRCMRFDFKLVSSEKIAELIEKIFNENNIKFEKNAVHLIARAGEGSVRDALSIADMVVSYSNSNVTFESVMEVVGSIEKDKLCEIANNLLGLNMGGVLVELDKILSEGKSPLVLSKELISYFRDLLVILSAPKICRNMVLVPDDIFNKMSLQATPENYVTIVRTIEKLSNVEQELRYSVHPKIVLETSLIAAVHANNLEKRIKILEEEVKNITINEIVKEVSIAEESAESKVETKDEQQTTYIESEADNEQNLDLIFGELLKYLRREQHKILYAICSEFEDVQILDKKLCFVVDDQDTFETLNKEENLQILDNFFENKGIGYKFIYKFKDEIISDLQNKLGDKLIINKD